MSRPPISTVVVLTVSRQKAMHYLPDVVRPPLDQQVDMIGHQAIRIQVKRQFLLLHRQLRNEFPMVLHRMKNIPAINPTCYNVIQTTLDLKSRFPGHTFPSSYHQTTIKENCENCRPDPNSSNVTQITYGSVGG